MMMIIIISIISIIMIIIIIAILLKKCDVSRQSQASGLDSFKRADRTPSQASHRLGNSCDFQWTTTLWWTNIAIEHGPVEIVDFPIKKMVIFHGFLYVHQAG